MLLPYTIRALPELTAPVVRDHTHPSRFGKKRENEQPDSTTISIAKKKTLQSHKVSGKQEKIPHLSLYQVVASLLARRERWVSAGVWHRGGQAAER